MKVNNKSLSFSIGGVEICTLVYGIKSRFILSTVVVTGSLLMKLNNKSLSLAMGGVEIRTLVYGIKSRFILSTFLEDQQNNIALNNLPRGALTRKVAENLLQALCLCSTRKYSYIIVNLHLTFHYFISSWFKPFEEKCLFHRYSC
jgi:hypothetical protein